MIIRCGCLPVARISHYVYSRTLSPVRLSTLRVSFLHFSHFPHLPLLQANLKVHDLLCLRKCVNLPYSWTYFQAFSHLYFEFKKSKTFQILWTFRNSTKKQKIYNGTHRSESHQEQLREISTRSAQTNWQKNNKYYDFSKTCRAVQVRCKTTQIRRGTRGGSFFRRSDKERSVRYAHLESTLPGGLEVTHIRINGCWKEGFVSFSTQGLDDDLYVVLQGSSMFEKRTMRSTRGRLCKE